MSDDCISRQVAIDVFKDAIGDKYPFICKPILATLSLIPSVTPKPVECDDCISRQQVLDFFKDDVYVCNEVKNLPSVNPKPKTDWIPVSERLPENAKHKGAFCPKYYVMTEFGQTEGWYNPDVGCWYVLLWFMDARFETWNISLERGDVPKLVKNVPVTAWMPLPEPYKAESEDKE